MDILIGELRVRKAERSKDELRTEPAQCKSSKQRNCQAICKTSQAANLFVSSAFSALHLYSERAGGSLSRGPLLDSREPDICHAALVFIMSDDLRPAFSLSLRNNELLGLSGKHDGKRDN